MINVLGKNAQTPAATKVLKLVGCVNSKWKQLARLTTKIHTCQ